MGEFKNKKEIFSYLWEKIKLAFILKDGTKVLSSNDYTTSEKSKLDGIEEGAQKNVQADWDATSGDTLILNKPSIPTALSELANDSGYIVGDLSQLETSEKESVILAINELLEKINSLKGGGGTTGGLTYSKVTLENGNTIWKGSDNKYYTDKTSEILVSPGSYTLSTGKILTIYSDGTGILSDPQPEGSLNLSYVFSNTTPGDGSGSIILSTTDSKYYGSYDIYYANATGVLGNYQAINYMDTTSNTGDEDCLELELKAGSTEFAFENFLSANMIPAEATRIVAIKHTGNAHSGSGEIVAQYVIPESKRFAAGTQGSKLYSVGMLSDIHVDSATDTSENDAGADVARAMSYFVDYGVTDVCCCGDITDDGTQTQWTAWNNFISSYKSSLNFHLACGNHDAREISTWTAANVGSNNYGGAAGTYTVQTIGNDKYVFLGIHQSYGEIFNSSEYAAFRADMESFEADPNVGRVFMFEHAPIPATVGNPNKVYAYNLWTNNSNDPYATTTYCNQFANYMKTYSKCIWFSGHSHTKFFLQSLDPTANYYEYPGGCKMIHIPSCTYPREWQWDSATGNYTTQTDDRRRYNDVASSEGIIMDVYSNCVVIKGINFKQNKFVPLAQYLIPTGVNVEGGGNEPTPEEPSTANILMYVDRVYSKSTDPFTDTTIGVKGRGTGWYMDNGEAKPTQCYIPSATNKFYIDKLPLQSLAAAEGTSKSLNKATSITPSGTVTTLSKWMMMVEVQGAETGNDTNQNSGVFGRAICDVPDDNDSGITVDIFGQSGVNIYMRTTNPIGGGINNPTSDGNTHVKIVMARDGETYSYTLDGSTWHTHETTTTPTDNAGKVLTLGGTNSLGNPFSGYVHMELYDDVDQTLVNEFFNTNWSPTPEGGDSDDDLTYIEVTLMAGATWYIGSDEKVYSTINGECDDAARTILGGSWRIPTIQDWEELCANTTQTIVTYEGTTCLRLYNSKGSLYIPVKGYKDGSSIQSTSFGEIWLANNLSEEYAAQVEFSRFQAQNTDLPYEQSWYFKYHGRNIRPVSDDEGVDLGLPSGLKWASMNLGASTITDAGGYYAWGEVETKTSYTEENYKYSQNNPYTSNGELLSLGKVLAHEGEYELSNGKLLTVYSNGTYTIADAPIHSEPAKKMTTWEEDFSDFNINKAYPDSSGWYEIEIDEGRLRTILREPDTTEKFATFFIDLPSPLNLSDGAYLSIDINSVSSEVGTAVGSASWNTGNCFNMRLVDGSGEVSSWIPICTNGIGSSGGIMPAGVSLDKEDISTYMGSVNTGDIVKLEISLIGWLDYATVSYKNRNKGVYIDNIRLSRNTTETAEEGAASGGTSGGGTTPSGPAKKMTTWSEDFSAGVSMVENDENGWYDLSASSGRLSAILREPDTTAKLACFIINTPSPLDLSDGAYMQIDIQGISDGTATVSSSWNNFSCFAMRLRDSSGAYTGWIEIDADGIGNANAGISDSNKVTMTSRTNIALYLGTSADLSNIVAAEITLIGWPSTTISYKARDKGVYIDNLVISRSATETAEEGAASSGSGGGSQGGGSTGDVTYRRVSASYSGLSTTNFNDVADVYSAVKSGDRLMLIVRHSERDSATGKDAGLNANGLAILQQTAAPKVVGAPFANASTDKYYSTNVKRTVETAYFIGKARGASGCTSSSLLGSNWENETAVDHSGDTSSSISWVKATPGPHTYFNDHFTGGTNWVTAQNYYKNSKTTCTNDCEAAINWLAEDSEGHPFVMVGSHDLCMVPFVCWAADNGNFFSTWNNDYDSNPSGWIMYMAGVAVIVHPDGGWEVYPVKMLDKGKFD